jgi:hypothetical protein
MSTHCRPRVHLRVRDEALAVVGAANVLEVLLSANGAQRPPAASEERQEQPPEGQDQALETNIASDKLDHEASTAEDLH